MGNYRSGAHIAEDHIDPHKTCNIEEPQQKYRLGTVSFNRLVGSFYVVRQSLCEKRGKYFQISLISLADVSINLKIMFTFFTSIHTYLPINQIVFWKGMSSETIQRPKLQIRFYSVCS